MRRAPAWIVAMAVAAGCDTSMPPADAGPSGLPDVGSDAGREDAGPVVPPFSLSEFVPCAGAPAAATYRCASFTVPIDWSDPTGPTLTRPVRLYPAPAASRIGVLVGNPGGPGTPTYPNAPGVSAAVRGAFDFVSVDWRGIGASDITFSCPRPPAVDRLRNYVSGGSLEGTIVEVVHLGDDISATCLADLDPLLVAHAGSADMARDLDALRMALGEASLSYLGFSYGTMLGAVYASLFPDRVRAFVLDSPLDPSEDLLSSRVSQILAQEAGIDRFLAWCAGEPGCAFARGRDAAGLRAALMALLAEYGARPRRTTRPDGTPYVFDALDVEQIVVVRVRSPATWGVLGRALAALEDGDLAGLVPSAATPTTLDLAFEVIRGADMPMPAWASEATLIEFVRSQVLPRAPVAGFGGAFGLAELLPIPAARELAAVHAPSAPPILVVANVGDTQTAYPGGARLVEALANGSYLLTYEGSGHALSSRVPCLTDAVTAFLLDPGTPPAIDRCAALPITP